MLFLLPTDRGRKNVMYMWVDQDLQANLTSNVVAWGDQRVGPSQPLSEIADRMFDPF
jgi:hypothetical protein